MDVMKSVREIYTAQITQSKLNVQILLSNPTSIPEHSDFVKELDKHIGDIATATDKLAVLIKHMEDL